MNETITLNKIEKPTNTDITVGTITLANLFKNNLSIPDFQRPYEWNDRLVLKLFQDIEEHFFHQEKLNDNASDFYLGSVLLNKKQDELFDIIDGQQRLTTFLILDYLIDPSESFLQNISFMFHSNISVNNIKLVNKVIENYRVQFKFAEKSIYKNIIDKIRLNIIITSNEEKAFQFFDSLNSKGKKLDTINILKSYHLRELKDEIQLQKKMATNFDSLNANIESKNFKENGIFSLDSFVSLLWVKHNYWTKGNFSPINKSVIELHLRDNSKQLTENPKAIKLFPSIRNLRNTEVVVGEGKNIYKSSYEELSGVNKVIEFNPMLPVQKGLGFFLSLEKLHHYFDILFIKSEYKELDKITTLVKTSFNTYFLHLYYLVVLGYYVKFEDDRLEEFAFEIEQILGNKFLYLQSVRKESPGKIMRDEFNVLQHIYLNVEPKYLFDELRIFKMNIKVDTIENFKEDGKEYVSFKHRDKFSKKFIAHGSRPTYVKRALELYALEESDIQDYTAISWEKNKLR